MKYSRFILPLTFVLLACSSVQQAVGMNFLRNVFEHGKRYLGLPAVIKDRVGNGDLSFTISEFFNHNVDNKKNVKIEIKLYKSECEVGRASVDIKTYSKAAYLERLHIIRGKRGNGFGSYLLQAVFLVLKQVGIKTVHWIVSPFDLARGENILEQLPKLIQFYQKHGAILDEAHKGLWPCMYRVL